MSSNKTFLGLTLSVLVATSHAAPLAEFHLTDLKYDLTDLDPSDGIDPSIVWDPIYRYTSLSAYVQSGSWLLQKSASGPDWGNYAVSFKGASASSTPY